jgi:hypothetical protein
MGPLETDTGVDNFRGPAPLAAPCPSDGSPWWDGGRAARSARVTSDRAPLDRHSVASTAGRCWNAHRVQFGGHLPMRHASQSGEHGADRE